MTMPPSATLQIEPADALIDVPRRIAVHGLAPHELVTIESRTVRAAGTAWQASARFRADANGEVDLWRDAPVAGDYDGTSPMGLVWAQRPADEASARLLFADDPTAPLVTDLEVRRDTGEPLRAHLVQRLLEGGVTRREVRDEGLCGTLFVPPGAGPHPAVVVLNGSGGGVNEPRGALYASRGFAAFALGYFKCPGRPDHISNTPLEYFETALDWVRREVRPRDGFIAVSGQSRGGELALLLGALMPERVSAVIGYVPGAVVHSAQNACDPALGREGPAWLWRGEPLPHLWQSNRTASWQPWDDGPEPRRHADALLTALRDDAAVERARIPVERIRGPVLLLTAGDDGSWPSSRYGRMVAERLAAVRHPHAVQHLDVEGAGHSILFPYLPSTQLQYRHPVSGRLSTTGGTPAANARADALSWPVVQRFLADAVQAHRPGPSKETP